MFGLFGTTDDPSLEIGASYYAQVRNAEEELNMETLSIETTDSWLVLVPATSRDDVSDGVELTQGMTVYKYGDEGLQPLELNVIPRGCGRGPRTRRCGTARSGPGRPAGCWSRKRGTTPACRWAAACSRAG